MAVSPNISKKSYFSAKYKSFGVAFTSIFPKEKRLAVSFTKAYTDGRHLSRAQVLSFCSFTNCSK